MHDLRRRHRQLLAQTAHARALALVQRRGPTLWQRLVFRASRSTLLVAPVYAVSALFAVPAAALLPSCLLSALPAPLAAAVPFVASLAWPLVRALLVLLLLLVPAAVSTELFLRVVRHYYVEPTYTLGQQWVLTGQGLEPALKPLRQYPRHYSDFNGVEGLFAGHRMKAYRARLGALLPGEALARIPSYRNLAGLQAAVARARSSGGGGGGGDGGCVDGGSA
jgi:hypothetical protein